MTYPTQPVFATGNLNCAIVHVSRSHPEGGPLQRARIDGNWPLRQRRSAAIDDYLAPLETLLAVAHRNVGSSRQLMIIDARWIVGYTMTDNHRVIFDTIPAPELEPMLNTPSPVTWPSGDGWPVKITQLPARPVSVAA